MRKLKKWLMALAMAAGVFSSTAMTAFAYTGDTGQTETAGEAAAGESLFPFLETGRYWTIRRMMERKSS